MKRAFAAPAWVALAILLLAGCVTQPPVPQTQSWESRRAELQQRDRFALRARLAVAAGQEGFNARLRWQQEGKRSLLSLDGPLGVGGAEVTFDGEQLVVRTSRGQQLDGDAARTEFAARLGFEPPLHSLRYWIQGVPDPATPGSETLGPQQHLESLNQDGWQVDYASYRADGAEWLPQRLTLHREGVRVKLFIDGWGP